MKRPYGFHYALQPVLLTRRWHYEQVQRELGDLNANRRREATVLNELQRQLSTVYAKWEMTAGSIRGSDTFLRYYRFIQDLHEQEDRSRDALHEIEKRRDAAISELASARKALEGIEQHKARVQKEFLKERMRQEYKHNDEMWNARAALRMDV